VLELLGPHRLLIKSQHIAISLKQTDSRKILRVGFHCILGRVRSVAARKKKHNNGYKYVTKYDHVIRSTQGMSKNEYIPVVYGSIL